MQPTYKRPRRPSQQKIDRDLVRFEAAASRLLLTISAIEANGGGVNTRGEFLNPLSPRFEAVVQVRNLLREVLS